MIDFKDRLTKDQMYKIARDGEVTFVQRDKSGEMDSVAAMILVDSTPEEAWNIAKDYGRYSEFVGLITRCKVREEGEGYQVVEMHAGLSVLVLKLGADVRLKVTTPSRSRIVHTRVGGSVNRMEGCWEFVPVEGGRKTVIVYTLDTNIGDLGRVMRLLLRQFPAFRAPLTAAVASMMVRALKRRVEEG